MELAQDRVQRLILALTALVMVLKLHREEAENQECQSIKQ
jgi:hypothetical protein